MDYKAAVITVSDRCSAGEKIDKSGPAVAQMLEEAGFKVIYKGLVPDERHEISSEFIKCAYELGADLIISTGGTGFGKRDITPEATRDVISREIPAIPQAMLHYSLERKTWELITPSNVDFTNKQLDVVFKDLSPVGVIAKVDASQAVTNTTGTSPKTGVDSTNTVPFAGAAVVLLGAAAVVAFRKKNA